MGIKQTHWFQMGKIHSICTLITNKNVSKTQKRNTLLDFFFGQVVNLFCGGGAEQAENLPSRCPTGWTGGEESTLHQFLGETLKGKDDNENIVVSHHFP